MSVKFFIVVTFDQGHHLLLVANVKLCKLDLSKWWLVYFVKLWPDSMKYKTFHNGNTAKICENEICKRWYVYPWSKMLGENN